VTTVELPETVVLPLDAIMPYWRNPRRIPAEAVDGVAKSLKGYGDIQPIVVDRDNVIIVGHTRYQALVQLGETETEVYVASDLTDAKAREYRVADNRLGEMTTWDHAALLMELREWELGLLADFFPEVDLEIDAINAAASDVTSAEIAKAQEDVRNIKDRDVIHVTRVECPACRQLFEVRTDSLPGLTRLDMEQLTARATAAGDGGA
jgi:hypothetical protein